MSDDRLVPAYNPNYVSDTPETDQVENYCINMKDNPEICGYIIEFARSLERRLNEMRKKND